MRNVVLGTIAGLFVGMVGALAYSHFLGDGSLLANLQAQLDAANADLSKLKSAKQQLAQESSGDSDQINALLASNDSLKKQVATLQAAPPSTNAPSFNPMALTGMFMSAMRGGGFQTQQRMFLLKTRLKLTPEQNAALQAAMEADAKNMRDMGRALFQGQKIDPAVAANANSLDKTVASVLTPEQLTQYQQVESEEKASRADTSATIQVNQVAPLLQLSDTQKDQVFSALYQVQSTAPDATTVMTSANPGATIAAQAQATSDALAKVLTPDQMTLYKQQSQNQPRFGGGRPPGM